MGGDTVQTAVRTAPLLECLAGKVHETPPMWMMRQAGRYLPEYRALRAEKGGFLELVYDSPSAAEITLQPLRRFDLDAAILFSDILIVPYAMGQNLQFLVGEGPHLSPTLVDHALESLVPAYERLDAIYETVRLVKAELAPEKAFLGFAGSAWTVATYMVNGEGSKDQHATRAYAYRDPQGFQVLIDAIVDLTITYLIGQIDAGVDAVQIFDSWSGSLAPSQFERWVIAPNARIAAAIHEARPGVPVIGFPKGAGEKLAAYARETGVDALGLDETIDPVWAAANIPAHLPVQGNLDPLALLAGGEQMESAVRHIIRTFEGRPHIFNLGHGILQQTPIEHVHALLTLVKQGA
ncbi:MAG: uroporphyrinogen decarboxylase [Blastomonas sp.]|uniref:Uroporphyrinogen decarboxylase n=1 Tax=Blastomonas fulva TaxID=1550728 RepID=A0ABN5B220_9SPHN|nr:MULTISPECIES: uroporphyrinogen decarboxylase [Blastomonas]ASR51110.1 uroporphyrinogen decarboxylase [Blastomonas fulva]MCO5791414.1 uroporphyrinogen decarboxylase [Blastomonas sp.]